MKKLLIVMLLAATLTGCDMFSTTGLISPTATPPKTPVNSTVSSKTNIPPKTTVALPTTETGGLKTLTRPTKTPATVPPATKSTPVPVYSKKLSVYTGSDRKALFYNSNEVSGLIWERDSGQYRWKATFIVYLVNEDKTDVKVSAKNIPIPDVNIVSSPIVVKAGASASYSITIQAVQRVHVNVDWIVFDVQ